MGSPNLGVRQWRAHMPGGQDTAGQTDAKVIQTVQ